MSVKLKIDAALSYYTSKQQLVEIKGNTVGECLENLVEQYPDFAKVMYFRENELASLVSVYIDGEGSPLEFSRPVKEGDELFVSFTSVG